MYAGYLYPYYRPYGYSLAYPYPFPYPYWNYGGYGGFGGYGYSNNIVGSAIATQSLINTGTVSGVSQIATPTVIW